MTVSSQTFFCVVSNVADTPTDFFFFFTGTVEPIIRKRTLAKGPGGLYYRGLIVDT